MTKEEIDTMWQQAMQESIKDGEMFTRYHFAEMVTEAERERIKQANAPEIEKINAHIQKAMTALEEVLAEHAMCKVQRLGQEIEQEPPQRTWIGLEGAEFGWFCHTDFLNARKYTKKQREHICCQLLSEAQSWDIGEYQLMMHDSTKRPQRTEQNFCPRCGKRTPDLITIHTCTPPQEGT